MNTMFKNYSDLAGYIFLINTEINSPYDHWTGLAAWQVLPKLRASTLRLFD